jgi:hypothetical protein
VIEAVAYPETLTIAAPPTQRRFASVLVSVLAILVVGALWFSGQGVLLRIAVPAAAALVAVVLYVTQPIAYIQ